MWSPWLTFLGTVITQCGNDNEAISGHPCSRTKRSLVAAHVSAFIASVLSSFGWQAQNWTPTKKQYSCTSSWFAPPSDQPCTESEDAPKNSMDSWWRRLHKDGNRFWTKNRVDVISAVKSAKFGFVGHIARLPGADTVHRVLKVRHLPWWRAQQATIHTNRGPRPHDSRFNAQHPWEGSLEVFSGPAIESQPLDASRSGQRRLESSRGTLRGNLTLCSTTVTISCSVGW